MKRHAEPAKGPSDHRERWPERFADAAQRWRWPIVSIWLALILAGFWAGQRISYDADVLVYFDDASSERAAFDAIEERFGRSQEVVSVIVPRGAAGVASPAALRLMARLAKASAERPEVAAVRTPLGLVGATPEAVLAADERALARLGAALEEAARGADAQGAALIAPDLRLAAVAAIVPAVADNEEGGRIAAAHAALRDRVARSQAFEVIQTGRIVIDAAFLEESRDDVNAYSGLQLAILAAVLLAALGSVSLCAAVLAMAVGIIGLTVGALGSDGVQINGISSAAPAVLMGLAVASAIHIVIAWQDAIRSGHDRRQAVALAYRANAKPVLLSITTTMVSFLVLNTAESPPFRDLGNIVAAGLVGIVALTFTLLPALLTLIPASAGRHRQNFERAMANLGAAAARRRALVLGLTGLLAAGAGLGAATITIDDTFSHYFDERYEVRRATDLFEAALSGTTIIDLAVDTHSPGSAFASGTLARVARLTAWLEGRGEVARVDSLTRVRAAVGEAREEALPARMAAAMDAMVREGVPRLMDETGRHIRFSVVMRGVSSRDTLTFAEAARAQAERLFPGGTVSVTGLPVLSAQLSLGSARAMIVGMALALVAISLILMATLRDVRLGVVSLVPNLLPVAMAFGLWGVIVGEVSFAATVVGALTYGIVVDDTVHILTKYQALRAVLPTPAAIRATYRSVGVAVVVTTAALALSFLPFALSGFLVNHQFGALTALTLGAALVADLLLLPALLTLIGRRNRATRERNRATAPGRLAKLS